MIYDYSKLLGEMRAQGISQEVLAKKININPATLYKKLHNKVDFKQNEMRNILYVLNVPISQVADYFFCRKTCEIASV